MCCISHVLPPGWLPGAQAWDERGTVLPGGGTCICSRREENLSWDKHSGPGGLGLSRPRAASISLACQGHLQPEGDSWKAMCGG